jgi:hypothetical protein
MHAVILTFPGHLYHTASCVGSVIQHYPEVKNFTFVLDDVEASDWTSYEQDFCAVIDVVAQRDWSLYKISEHAQISTCVAGWWRQQLIKLSLDQILPDDSWLVIDGDVVFKTRCDIRDQIPISLHVQHDSRWSHMSRRYVQHLLGIEQPGLAHQGQDVITSAVPFRWLTADLLAGLRSHVAQRFGQDFVELHLAWFADQTIVADIDPPDRMVMSEWEIIECYRRYVLGMELPMLDIGSGYQLDVDFKDLNSQHIFLHSYLRDAEVGRKWFEDSGLQIDDDVWYRLQKWYEHKESNRQA